MKKKVKRKYTREPKQDALESISSPVKEESSIVDRITGEITEIKPTFTYDNLPMGIRVGVDRAIKLRARLHLPDDSKERKQRAVRYFRGDRPR